jgi:Caspase domain
MSEFARNLAIVIGINNYQNSISPLRNAVNDATKLKQILEQKHQYDRVWQLLDDRATLKILNNFLENVLPQHVQPDDRLIFYFAGHGIALNGENGPTGYLIPQDAILGDPQTYLPMTDLQACLEKLTCRHFLGILDCCFAGAFRWSSTRDLRSVPEVIHQERYARFIADPAWQVITSAAADQKALDVFAINTERGTAGEHSPFAAALIEALEGKADTHPPAANGRLPGDGVITATELYLYLRDRIESTDVGNRLRQTPGIWPLNKHDKGEYIFLAPGHSLNLPPAPPLDKSQNPYRGLESFEAKDSALFFGRTDSIVRLNEFVSSHPLTIVLGASGSGKSSLVKAGLVPHLEQQTTKSERQWQILAPFRPGESPLQALNNTLVRAKLAGASITQLGIEQKVATLSSYLAAWSQQYPDAKLLLVIDQFEELMTLCQNDSEREQFLCLLAQAIAQHSEQLRLVLTLRSDFEPQFRDTALMEYWHVSRFIMSPMTRADLRAAIEKPAQTRVMYFEPSELVEQLIDEVADMPGSLPLLSFALSELYLKYLNRQREAQNGGSTINRSLTQADYDALGGVIRSLTQRADEEYQALVTENSAYAQIIRQVMLRMVAIGGGELARRQVPLSELEYPPSKNGLVKEVIERFTQARLLVKGEDAESNCYVEPAHDALVRGWQRLLEWKQEEEESLLLQRRLTPAAQEWKNLNSQKRRLGFPATENVIDWLDRQLYTVENFCTAQWVRLWRRTRNRQQIVGGLVMSEVVGVGDSLPLGTASALAEVASPLENREHPRQFLWDANPYLTVLEQEFNANDSWLSQVEAEFVRQSVWQKRRNKSWRWRIAIAVMLVLGGLTVWALANL